jgi:outer membrane immunogenic protein
MKKCCVFLIFLFTFLDCFSQWEVALKSGVHIVTTKNLIAFPKNRIGWYMGLHTQVPLINKFSLQPALLFSSKGYKSEDQFGTIFQSVRLEYVALPLLINYNIDEKLSIQLGPEFGYLLAAKLLLDEEKFNVSKQYPSKFDAGLSIGLQYLAVRRTGIDLRYTYGINTLYSVDANGVRYSDRKGANRAFQIGLSYILKN